MNGVNGWFCDSDLLFVSLLSRAACNDTEQTINFSCAWGPASPTGSNSSVLLAPDWWLTGKLSCRSQGLLELHQSRSTLLHLCSFLL